MPKILFAGNEFDSRHEAICAALFNKYGWRWEKPSHPLGGWLPDFVLKGDTSVYVECKGQLKWDAVRGGGAAASLSKYEDAVAGSSMEVLLIPESPREVENSRGFKNSVLGFLYDGNVWSYAELGRWSGKVGFSHVANRWKDRMSGEEVGRPSGDGQAPDIAVDWRSATHTVNNKRVSFFKASVDSPLEEWEASS